MKHVMAAMAAMLSLVTLAWAQPELMGRLELRGPSDTARALEPTGAPVIAGQVRCDGLTQNTNPNLVLFPFNVVCSAPAQNCTAANDYARSFDLSVGPTAGLAHLVRCVEYGVDEVLDSTGFSPVTVSLFIDTNGGAPNNANLVPVPGGSITDMVPHGTTGALRSIDFTANNVLVPADATLVVMVSSPNLCATRGANHRYTNGANNAGQSAPSYLRASGCGIVDFANLATLGAFADVHMVLSVGLQPHGLSATKTDALLTDVDGDGDGEADPGDTLRYTVVIRNVGDAAVEGTQFSDTVDPNTTLVPGSVSSTPIARDDSYESIGNVGIAVPAASGVLSNDSDPDGDPVFVTAYDAVGVNGGAVAMNADGSFTYMPAMGFEGDDTFTYTIEDPDGNQDTATVTVAVSDVIWFIDNEAGAPGNGKLGSPFSSVANFIALAADDPGDIIFVYSGDGLYAGTLTLLNDQFLIGQGATDSIASITGITVPPFSNPLPATGSFRPLLEYVNVATNNYVRGLDLRGSTAATALLGGNVGTLHVSEMAVTNTAGPGVSLATGTLDVTLDSVNTTLGVHGIRMSAVNGSFASLGGTIQDTTSHGVYVTNNGATLDLTLADMLIDDAAAHGVLIEVPAGGTGGFGLVTIDDVTISDSTTSGLRASISSTGMLGLLDIFDSTFTNNQGIEVIASGTADVEFDIYDNLAISGRGTQILIAAQDATANDGIGPIMEGRIANNAGIVSTGAGGTAVAINSVGDGDIIVDVDGNTITGFGQTGMLVQADTGQSQIHATIRNNAISTADATTQAGLHMRSALSTGQASLLCVNLSSNNIDAGGGTVSLADYSLVKGASVATFQIQGLPGAPVVVAATGPGSAVGTYVKNTDLNPGIRTETVGAGTYAAAVCQVAMPSAAREAPAVAAVGDMPVASTRDDDPREEAELLTPFAPGGGVVASGETVNLNIGTLDPGQEVTITFDVTIDNPVDPRNTTRVCNQGTVSSDNAPTVLTDDPDTADADDPTCTPLDVATITISKVAVGGDVGDNPTFQFHGSDPIDDFGLMAGGSQAFPNLTAGTYTVVEDLPPGWVFDHMICSVLHPSSVTPVDGGISIMLNGGDTSCTFYNRYQRGNLIVNKEADPADDTVFSYTTDIPSTPNFTLRDPSFSGKNIPNIPIGDYTVTEAAMPGWALRDITCTGDYSVSGNSVTVTIPDRETVSCTFKNEKLGSIKVRKFTDPGGGTDFGFRGDLGEFTLDDGGEQLFGNLEKGDYSIIENVPSGWRLDDVVCEGAASTRTDGGVIVHLTVGEDVVCTFYDVFVPDRVSASKKGSLLMFSKVELRWADGPAGALRQDTVLELTNDYHEEVCVQLYIVNGDAPLDPVLDPVTGSVVVEGEAGWEWADCQLCLTPDETTYWSAATGLAAGCQPFTVLDPSTGSGPGRPDPTTPGERHLRGFVYAWAVDQDGHAISWNHLSGAATLINYFNTDAWDYNAWAFQANLNCERICEDPKRCEEPRLVCTAVPHGGRIGEPGRLRIDGYEYDFGFDVLLMDFMASGSRALGSGASVVTSDTDLTLHPITADLRQDSIGPVTTKAEFAIWNEDERRFSGTTRCITCWDQTLLSLYGNPNHFLREHLQTDKGKARIDGVESTVCDQNCVRDQYPHGGLDIDFILDILGIDHVCSFDASMLGVVAKTLAFSGAATARATAGRNLVGMGTESGWIKWDIVAPPSHVRAPVEKNGRTGRAPR